MTKSKYLNNVDPELWKATTGVLATSWATFMIFAGKYIFKFLKKRNNELTLLNERVTKIEQSLLITKIDVVDGKNIINKISLSDYVQNLSHDLKNNEHGVSSSFTYILDELKLINDNINKKTK